MQMVEGMHTCAKEKGWETELRLNEDNVLTNTRWKQTYVGEIIHNCRRNNFLEKILDPTLRMLMQFEKCWRKIFGDF